MPHLSLHRNLIYFIINIYFTIVSEQLDSPTVVFIVSMFVFKPVLAKHVVLCTSYKKIKVVPI